MCGFFGISDKDLIDWNRVDLEDVNERGEYQFPFIGKKVFLHQSVLPVTEDFQALKYLKQDISILHLQVKYIMPLIKAMQTIQNGFKKK